MFHYTLNSIQEFLRRMLHSPFGFQLGILSLFLFFLTSFQPTYFFWEKQAFGEQFFFQKEELFSITEPGFIDNFARIENSGLEEVFVEDEDGNLIRKTTLRNETKKIDYIIKSGDNLLQISHKFGLNVSTLLWANNLTAKEALVPGETIIIPPTDGVYYTVELGDTLGEVAKIHSIPVNDIYKYNNINEKGMIKRNTQLFLPKAKKIYIEHTVFKPKISSITNTLSPVISTGLRIKRPTIGVLTQAPRAGHTAMDIANSLNTPIYAAYEGTVITAQGGWNYGYGVYVILDNGNNVKTLYAHMNTYEVEVGQRVKKGELVGKMGNSGNVIGRTGIHLHFELQINGKKLDPRPYFEN